MLLVIYMVVVEFIHMFSVYASYIFLLHYLNSNINYKKLNSNYYYCTTL